MPTMTAADLLAAGFKRYDPGLKSDYATDLYQTTIRGTTGRAMFSISVYAMRRFPGMPDAPWQRYQWSIGAQMYRNGLTMDLTLHHEPSRTPDDIIAFYRDAWFALDCTYDPHND